MSYSASWKYNQSGALPAANWMTAAYVDTAWPSGNGVLGYPSDENLLGLATLTTGLERFIPGSTTTQVQTYYFRGRFNYSGSTSGITLIMTNILDDGAVIYLNGTEIARVGMPTGAITYSTQATTRPAGDDFSQHNVDVVSVVPSNLIAGQNLIAVEVHQTGTTSSDALFGMSLIALQPASIAITNQPQSQTAQVGDSVSFSVGVSGGPATYQWFKDGGVLAGQTASTLTLNSVTLASAGTYTVRVSNTVNVATSLGAVLTVLQDTQGPEMISANVQDTGLTNQIALTFDENLALTSVNSNNIRVVVGGTSGASASYVIISNVTLIGRTALVRVGGPNWNLFGNYYVIANNVADTRGNLIAPNSVIPIAWPARTNVIQMSASWDFHSAIFDPNATNLISGSVPWYRTNFVPDMTYWGTGGGIFWFDQAQTAQLCAGDGLSPDNISFQDFPTLFRTKFNLGTNFGASGYISGTLQLRFMVDDGMILYLNGLPIYTNNLPAGPFTASTKAVNAIGEPTCTGPVLLQVTNLLPRTNWLAAAVVQANTSGADVYFGVELDGIFYRSGTTPTNGPTSNLRLTATKPSTNTVRIAWPNTAPNIYYGWNLQSKASITNSLWMTVSNQSNGMVIPASQAAQFYRLCKGVNSPN